MSVSYGVLWRFVALTIIPHFLIFVSLNKNGSNQNVILNDNININTDPIQIIIILSDLDFLGKCKIKHYIYSM